ncbi:Light-sensor Protein kinase [Bachmanniomyces sp. S44760]|nr:Light-sensor Protein kinase [Bachmanniomyces sp. S44760]
MSTSNPNSNQEHGDQRRTGNQPQSPHRRAISEQLPSSPRLPGPRLWEDGAAPKSYKPGQIEGSPTSTVSDQHLDSLSSGAQDRVFPIRSVVSFDPARTTPLGRSEGPDNGFPGMVPANGTSVRSKRRSDSCRYSEHDVQSVGRVSADQQDRTPSKPSQELAREAHIQGREKAMGDKREHINIDANPDCSEDHNRTFAGDDNESSNSNCTAATGIALTASNSESGKDLNDESGSLITSRFKHLVTEGGHAIITGRDGDTLQRCEDEPIHIPGAIQGFGLLIAVEEAADGKLVVRVASENSKAIIGYSPKQLFALDSFCDILSEEQRDNLLDHLDFIRDEEYDPATSGPEVFTLAIRSPTRRTQKLWCAMHINEKNPGLVICEFELEDDTINPMVPTGDTSPKPPEDTLQLNPSADILAESTFNHSKPLRVLRSARRRKGEAAAVEVFNVISQVQEQLAHAPDLEMFLKILVGVVKELTGFHRVMVYQFDAEWNGRVVTELVDPRATKDLYKGLNFPASDIPKQARDLYKINKVRLLYDRDQETARLVCRTVEELETPLDLTYAYLRAMSPIHIKYLKNMAVRSSMSISINAFNELWGLIACHTYGSKGMRVSFPIRKMCRLVGDSASRNIERLSYASRLQARKLINTIPTESNPSGYIIASSDDLLKLFDADYGLLSVRDETKILGKIEQTQEALAILEYLRLRKITSIITSHDVRLDFPDLRYPPGFKNLAGLLLVPLSSSGEDFIVFFRVGQTREVRWAGNPYEKFIKEGTEGYLEPRKSFKTWTETVVGKCREWTEEQVETASVLCLVYGKFIEVWRQKEAALQNTQLTRLLLANSAHEVRTPLNAIINYLEIAMEGSLDQETRENLTKSHSASKSLIYVINDLLDLTKTEKGHELIKDEIFDLPATVREAAEMFSGDAKRKQLEYEVAEHPGIPRLVVGDQRRVRQAISNVTANAFQHTDNGAVKIELWLVECDQDRAEVNIVITDTGAGMSTSKLDSLFRDLEQVQMESDEGPHDKLAPDIKGVTPGSEDRRTLGLGLAVVARIIRNMDGQLRLKSEEGKGSRFVIQLGFDLPPQEPQKNTMIEDARSAGLGPPSGQPTTPPGVEGEMLLVDKSAQKSRPSSAHRVIGHRPSGESMNSAKSIKSQSSGRSDIDQLIGVIQESPFGSMKSEARPTRSDAFDKSGRGVVNTPLKTSSIKKPYTTGEQEMVSTSSPIPGQESVNSSKTPIKAIRIPDESSQRTSVPSRAQKVLFDGSNRFPSREGATNADNLRVLVAEDDPINSKILKKRLEKIGHEVYLTINGEECSSTYGERNAFFDVVLMDMQVSSASRGGSSRRLTEEQMPIVDGLTSTKMIRSYEKSHPDEILSQRAAVNGRVPIFAVSASLVERNCQLYIDGGFDGWILKPIDFKRLAELLCGIVDEQSRKRNLYKTGNWEQGGWFAQRQPDLFAASTKPNADAAVHGAPPSTSLVTHGGDDPFDDRISKEQDRLESLTTDAVHADSSPSESR